MIAYKGSRRFCQTGQFHSLFHPGGEFDRYLVKGLIMFIWPEKDEDEMKKDVVNGKRKRMRRRKRKIKKSIAPHERHMHTIDIDITSAPAPVRCRHGSNFQTQFLSFEVLSLYFRQNGTESGA